MKQLEHIQDNDKIIKIIKMFLPNARVYLFGSRARGDNSDYSDIDIAIDCNHPITIRILRKISDMIEALDLFHKVDLIDLHSVSIHMKNSIISEGILWNE
jgi:predicted nucleotidyltransferase